MLERDMTIFKTDILKPIYEKVKRYNVIALDTEDDSKGGFIRACLMIDDETYIFDNKYFCKQWIIDFSKTKKAKKYLLWAHNLSYDIVNIFYPFEEDMEIIINANRILAIRLNNLLMYDTFNHSYTSLEKIGKIFNYEKMDFDRYSKAYVTRDTEIVYKYACFLQDMYNQYGITVPLSLASGALKIWRRLFQNKTYKVLSNEVLDVIRKAYFGGRVEAYFIGKYKGNVLYYDVNSMYPFVMQKEYTDINCLEYTESVSIQDKGVIYADIEVPNMYIPPLPYRLDKLITIYPVGKFSGYYSHIELNYAQSIGCTVIRKHGLVTKKSACVFNKYVEHFYNARVESNTESEKLFYKLLMNSLYGKFGTGKDKHILKPYTKDIRYDFVREIFLSKYVLEIDDSNYPIYSNIWALEVTAYARTLLHKLMYDVINKNGKILYCDTDAIIYDGNPIFQNATTLGGLKLEGQSNTIEILGAKEYIFDNKTKAKGIPRKAYKNNVEYNPQEEYLHKGATIYQKPIRLMEGLRRGLSPNIWHNVIKTKNVKYDRRIVDKNGFTFPYHVDEKNKTERKKKHVTSKLGKSSKRDKRGAKRG